MNFKFVDELPAKAPTRNKTSVLDAFAKALKKNPGVWAEYPKKLTDSSKYSYATQINRGKSERGTLSHGGFEAAVRNKKLYVRAKYNALAYTRAESA